MTLPGDRITHTLLCAGALFIWYAISVLVGALPNFTYLQSSGLLMPLLCALEFAALVPVYRWYVRSYDTPIPSGRLTLRQALLFSAMLIALIAAQSLYLQREGWTGAQQTGSLYTVVLFSLAVVLLAPVYEEILFRGFVLQGLLLWAPRQRLACSLLSSLIFAAVHTQYVHLQTLIALMLLSLLLCAARFVSNGLRLPIFLHMLNNFLGVAPGLWLAFSH